MTEPLGGKPNPGTKPDKRLKNNRQKYQDETTEHFDSSAFVSDAPWDGGAGRFTDEQYQSAAAACDPASKGTVKQRCFLPHHEPGGQVSRAGVHAAAQRVSSLQGRSPDAVSRAKSHLRSHYTRDLDEEPPDSLAAHSHVEPMSDAEHEAFHAAELADVPAEPVSPHWRGVLVVEGTPTGDGREFAPGSLSWPPEGDVTIPLQWQMESSHGGDHDKTVAVGRIDKIERQGAQLIGEGRFDTHPDAVEAHRRMKDEMLTGVSILSDDIKDAEIEYIWPDKAVEGEDDDGDILSLLFARPDKAIYHAGRIRAATLVDVPAFVEAVLHVVGQEEAEQAPLVASVTPLRAVAVHETGSSSDVWDGAKAEANLLKFITVDVARAAYAYVDKWSGTYAAKTDCRFLHHEISEDGTPGAANLSACSALLSTVHTARISDADKPAVYEHLAAHLRKAGENPPPYEPQHVLTAAAWQDDAWRPAAAWFQNPQLSHYTPILVTDAGQVYGHAAAWGECHIGYANECIMPPREAYHDRFLTGEQPLDDGSTIAVGTITAGIGHAPMNLKAAPAAEHYDNTDAVVAHVQVGNDRVGIWVAGGVPPWAHTARVAALRASGEVSPDWRRAGGQMRMVGLLTVNVSGYIAPRARSLVAAGQLQSLIASALVPAHRGEDGEQARLRHEMELLAARVHG